MGKGVNIDIYQVPLCTLIPKYVEPHCNSKKNQHNEQNKNFSSTVLLGQS